MIFFWADPKRKRYVIGNRHVRFQEFKKCLKQAFSIAVTYRKITGCGKLGYKINTIHDAADGAISPRYPTRDWMAEDASSVRETTNLMKF